MEAQQQGRKFVPILPAPGRVEAPGSPPRGGDAAQGRKSLPNPRKQHVLVACNGCRRRKSKCNGQKPTCGCCGRRDEACVYAGTEGTSWALKKRYSEVKHENAQYRKLLDLISSQSDEEARELFARLRASKQPMSIEDVVGRELAGPSNPSPLRTNLPHAWQPVEENFYTLVHTVRDYAIFLLDNQGTIKTWNIGAEQIKGYRKEDIIGKNFSSFYSEEDVRAGKPEKELQVCLREGRVEDEGWRYRKDGSRFWANVIITAIYKNDMHVGFGKVTRDLTARKLAEMRPVPGRDWGA